MPKVEMKSVPVRKGAGYPRPFDEPCAARTRRRLGDAGGLRDFGVNLMTLPPGGWSSQRRWHSHEDEFVYVLEGELALVEDAGETLLRAGEICTQGRYAVSFLVVGRGVRGRAVVELNFTAGR